jgi:molecular chaperone HscB
MRLRRKLQCLTLPFGLLSIVSLSSTNYFDLFSLPQSFQVPLDTLDVQYRKLQALCHPDRVVDGSDSERLDAVRQTSLVNDAYDTLKSPLKRAAYLLRLAEINPDQHDQSQLEPGFLLEQMQLWEKLEDLIASENLEKLDALKGSVAGQRDQEIQNFTQAMENMDYGTAKAVYHKLQFLYKLLDEIDSAEEKLLDY